MRSVFFFGLLLAAAGLHAASQDNWRYDGLSFGSPDGQFDWSSSSSVNIIAVSEQDEVYAANRQQRRPHARILDARKRPRLYPLAAAFNF